MAGQKGAKGDRWGSGRDLERAQACGTRFRIAPVAQLDRALRFERSGRRFESVRARNDWTFRVGRGLTGLAHPECPVIGAPIDSGTAERDSGGVFDNPAESLRPGWTHERG